jgi:hypothetical protein
MDQQLVDLMPEGFELFRVAGGERLVKRVFLTDEGVSEDAG